MRDCYGVSIGENDLVLVSIVTLGGVLAVCKVVSIQDDTAVLSVLNDYSHSHFPVSIKKFHGIKLAVTEQQYYQECKHHAHNSTDVA